MKDITTMQAVMICHKDYLKIQECLLYTSLKRTQFAKKCQEYGVVKSTSGYFRREDIDRMMAGIMPEEVPSNSKIKLK